MLVKNRSQEKRGRFYIYKMTVDDGGAPFIANGLLTLAICKPKIRSAAEKGDYLLGFGGNHLGKNRLIYIARITQKLVDGKYYKNNEYASRLDSIYVWRKGKFFWKRWSKFHSSRNLKHDLGSFPDYRLSSVLLSEDFRYFGNSGEVPDKKTYKTLITTLNRLRQGHFVNFKQRLRNNLEKLIKEKWTLQDQVLGFPIDLDGTGHASLCSKGKCEAGECEIC